MRAARLCVPMAVLLLVIAAPGGTLAAVARAPSPASSCAVAGTLDSLSGVAALSPSDVWAVGDYNDGQAPQNLIERWNGTHWCPVASPDPGGPGQPYSLLGVVATSSSNAWAAGGGLILHWDGTKWSTAAIPPGSGPAAVAATSSSDAWAVGEHYNSSLNTDRTLILHWDGTAWTKVPSPNPAGSISDVLDGVAVTSATDGWAVGSYYSTAHQATRTLILHWDGTRWSKVASPSPTCPAGGLGLDGVAAASSSEAWAVGYCYSNSGVKTVILHWDGTAWTRVPSPDPGGSRGSALTAVAVVPGSPATAWAVGSYGVGTLGANQSLILHWDGTAWTKVPNPNPGGTAALNLLNGVTALSSSQAWTVGCYTTSLTTNCHTLVEHWDGIAWTQQTSP